MNIFPKSIHIFSNLHTREMRNLQAQLRCKQIHLPHQCLPISMLFSQLYLCCTLSPTLFPSSEPTSKAISLEDEHCLFKLPLRVSYVCSTSLTIFIIFYCHRCHLCLISSKYKFWGLLLNTYIAFWVSRMPSFCLEGSWMSGNTVKTLLPTCISLVSPSKPLEPWQACLLRQSTTSLHRTLYEKHSADSDGQATQGTLRV